MNKQNAECSHFFGPDFTRYISGRIFGLAWKPDSVILPNSPLFYSGQ